MINLRYHIVSLVAVFLALGLGILMGSTVIDQGIVARLRSQTDALAGSLDQLRDENGGLKRQQELWDAYGRAQFSRSLKGRLAGRRTLVLSQHGAPSRVLEGVSSALADAGALDTGKIALSDKWKLDEDTEREQLALALGVPVASARDLWATAAGRLAGRLGQSRDPATQGDLLAALRDAGFLSIEGAEAGAFPATGAAVVLVASGEKESSPPQADFLLPLVKALAPARAVAVAEPLSSPESLAERVRRDGTLSLKAATVDDADIMLGRMALVSALRTLFSGGPAPHYGARRSATALLPDTPAP